MEASPNQANHRTVLYSAAEVAAQRAAPRKGFLNRRFKPAFAYFSRARKVGQGSGGGQPTGLQIETFSIDIHSSTHSTKSPG